MDGRVDSVGALVEANARLARLNALAAGPGSAALSVPQVAGVVDLVRTLGIEIEQRVLAANGETDVELTLRGRPEEGMVAITATEWLDRAIHDGAAGVDADAILAALTPITTNPAGGGQIEAALRRSLDEIVASAGNLSEASRNGVTERYVGYADDILSAARHLVSLVVDLAVVVESTTERQLPDLAAFDLADACRAAAKWLDAEALRRSVEIQRPAPTMRLLARGELRRTRQILINLVANAVGHSPVGGMVSIRCLHLDGRAVAIVSDQGEGVAPQDRERIFEQFVRLDDGNRKGVGLGLYIARRLARAMGGDVAADDTGGKGSRFVLSLPAGEG